MEKHSIKYNIIVSIGIRVVITIMLAMLAGITMLFINAILTLFDAKHITYGTSFLIVVFIAIVKKIF